MKKIANTQILLFLTIILLITLSITTLIPSLARLVNRHTIVSTDAWDGSVATKFKSGDGSVDSPFIISNGSELAYLEQTLNTMDYSGYYFELTKDIVLNKGTFDYNEEDGITYTLDDNTYYIEEYTNEIYEDKDRTIVFDQGPHVAKFNPFNPLNNFKGNLNGNNFTIKGLYLSGTDDKLGLFTNLNGNISNLYLDDVLVYGGSATASLASNTKDNQITNVMATGDVISSALTSSTKNHNLSNMTIETFNNTAHNSLEIDNYIPLDNAEVESITLSGNYTLDQNLDTIVKINNQTLNESNFTLDLTSEDLSQIYIDIESDGNQKVTLKNLKLKIESNEQVAGGIIGTSNNVTLRNVINKVKVTTNMYAGGLIASSKGNTNIYNSYNLESINAPFSSGILGVLKNSEALINKVYNTGSGEYAFINSIENSGAVIENSFNITENQEINENNEDSVNITNSYSTINSYFEKTELDNFYDKDFLNNTLNFNEYVDSTERLENSWIYIPDALPILFIDDASKKIATIYAGTYNFDNYSDILSPIKFNDSIKFTIELDDYYKNDTEVFYTISDEVLTKDELDELEFNPYFGLVNIETEGVNIIYAKLVRTSGEVTYINTDRLVISDALPKVEVKVNDRTYNNLRVENLDTIYVDRPTEILVEANSLIDDYLDINYYVTNEIKMESQIKDISDSEWLDYNGELKIDEIGLFLVIIKVTDSSGADVYVNTDFIKLDGYIAKKTQCGINNISYDKLEITKNSSMYFNFTYESALDNKQYTHFLKTSDILPIGTTLNLIDNKTNKYYEYVVEENVNKIPFTNFYEIGTDNDDLFYEEFNYFENDFIKEDFSVVADFSTSIINSDYEDFMLSLSATSEDIKRDTIYTTIKPFNIINEEQISYLTTEFSETINLNTPVTTNITINTGINTSSNNTANENKSLGLLLKILDSEGEIVDGKLLNNLYFKVGEEFYYPEDDNSIRIKLTDNIVDLSITAINDKSPLETGDYSLLIENFISDDGKYYSNKLGDSINIDLTVDKREELNNKVSIKLNEESRVINKTSDTEELIFDIENEDNLDIKVSLYKKDQLTAYNQDYTIVDINSVLKNELNKYADNIYDIGILEFNTVLLENTGYKLSFLIYEDDELIESIDEYFIVR